MANAQRQTSPRTRSNADRDLPDREGHHLFCYPFAGRLVHEGLASLVAFHAGQHQPDSFSTACNDYGFEVLARQPTDWAEILRPAFDPEALGSSLLQAMNLGELSRREFREVARIAGLVFEGYPGLENPTGNCKPAAVFCTTSLCNTTPITY